MEKQELIDRKHLLKKLCDGDPSHMEDYYYNAIADEPVVDPYPKKIIIDRIDANPGRRLKAVVSLCLGDFVIHGIKVFGVPTGLGVVMPMVYEDGQSVDLFHSTTIEARSNLEKAIIKTVEEELEKETEK